MTPTLFRLQVRWILARHWLARKLARLAQAVSPPENIVRDLHGRVVGITRPHRTTHRLARRSKR